MKKDKSIYQTAREEAGLTRREASERLGFLSENRIEKIENGKSQIQPAEVLAMEAAYKDPLLVNQHCTKACAIGMKTIPVLHRRALSETVIDLLLQKKRMDALMDRLLEAARTDQWTDQDQRVLEEMASLCQTIGGLGDQMKIHVMERKKENE